jgi:hypothetical protein
MILWLIFFLQRQYKTWQSFSKVVCNLKSQSQDKTFLRISKRWDENYTLPYLVFYNEYETHLIPYTSRTHRIWRV